MTLKRKVINEESFTFWSTGEAGSVSIAQAAGSTDTTTTGTTTPTDPGTGTDDSKRRPNRETFSGKLQAIRNAISSSTTDLVLKQLMEQYNFGDARMQEGAALLSEAESLFVQQQILKGAQKAATRAVDGAYNKAEHTLKRMIKTAKLAYMDNREMQEKLRVVGDRGKSFAEWLEQGKIFYSNILSLSEVIAEFAKYNVPLTDIELGRQELLLAETAKANQFALTADAQVLTDRKIIADNNLSQWWMNFRKIATVALEKQPQLLEKVGIVVPTRARSKGVS